MKHPGTHRVVATHGFGRNTGSRHKFQALVLEGCQGEIISLLTVRKCGMLLTVRKCGMVCNLRCIVYYFVVSFFRGLWMKVSDRHICILQGFEMHVYGL